MAVSDWESDWMNGKQGKASEYDSKGMKIPVVATPAPATPATPAPTYNIGSSGTGVSAIQQQLKDKGFDPGPIDGIYGPQTAAAVRAFQTASGIAVDGIYGAQSAGVMSNYNPLAGAVPATPAAPTAAPTVTDYESDFMNGKQGAPTDYDAKGMKTTTPATPTATNVTPEIYQQTLAKMQENSAAYGTATPENQKLYEKGNETLGASIGLTKSPEGVWLKPDGTPAYPTIPAAEGTAKDPATTGLSGDTAKDPGTETETALPEEDKYVSPYADELKAIMDTINNYPDYKSPFTGQIQQVLNEVLNSKFSYDPSTDTQLQGASKELSRIVMEEMNKRGILNSTITQDRLQQEIARLIPQFRKIRENEFQQDLDRKIQTLGYLEKFESNNYGQYKDEYEKVKDMADYVLKLDERDFNMYKETLAQKIKEKELAYKQMLDRIELERKQVQDAWARVNNMGFVDNESSIILKIDPSTPALSVQNNIQKRLWEIEDRERKIQAALDKDAQNFNQQVELTKIKEQQELEKNSVSNLGTPEQLKNYYNLRDIYFGGGSGKYKGDPQSAYGQLLSNAQGNIDLVGDKLYNQLKNDLKEYISSQPKKEEMKSSDYKTNPDYVDDVTYINENPKEALKEIQGMAKELIEKYGYTGYSELVKLAENAY